MGLRFCLMAWLFAFGTVIDRAMARDERSVSNSTPETRSTPPDPTDSGPAELGALPCHPSIERRRLTAQHHAHLDRLVSGRRQEGCQAGSVLAGILARTRGVVVACL